MIYQCYFDESQKSRLFTEAPYCGFGLYTTVNPGITHNCPELVDPAVQAQLSEYVAMLYHWRNPEVNPNDWIGFTSYRQLEKFPTKFVSCNQVVNYLKECDVLGWGAYRFYQPDDNRPVNLASQGESAHVGLTTTLARLLAKAGETLPINYLAENMGLFCNYWAMSKAKFHEYMKWSFPLINECLISPDAFTRSHPRALSYLVERLFICWYMNRTLRTGIVPPIQDIAFIPRLSAPGKTENFIQLVSWNMPLSELCFHFQFQPKGIIHIGAHYAEEREHYYRMQIPKVLWIEADPANMPTLQANIQGLPGHRAIQACLADRDGELTPFFRTNNRGESSSILPMKGHRQVYPDIEVVEQATLTTATFVKLAEREKLQMCDYDFLVLDVQGAELRVLEGFEHLIAGIRGIYLEVNTRQLYENCALLPDVDRFLKDRGFERCETLMTDRGYGDALYLRQEHVLEAFQNTKAAVTNLHKQVFLTRAFEYHLLGQPPQEIELVSDGIIGQGSQPWMKNWLVRACGSDVLLEFTGEPGRTHYFYPSHDGIWRGVSALDPQRFIQLVPKNLVGKLAPSGFPYHSNMPLDLVDKLRLQLDLKCFIETGTFQGATTRTMASRFEQVFTIEAAPKIYEQTSMALASVHNVRCYLGDSASVLPEILRQLHSPAMFWLDAHWCGEGTGLSQTECPLLRELELIFSHHRGHVIMIDDARCFLAPPPPPHRASDWPSFTDICNFLMNFRPYPIVQLLGDVIYIGPRSTAPTVTECSRQLAKSDASFEVVYPWF